MTKPIQSFVSNTGKLVGKVGSFLAGGSDTAAAAPAPAASTPPPEPVATPETPPAPVAPPPPAPPAAIAPPAVAPVPQPNSTAMRSIVQSVIGQQLAGYGRSDTILTRPGARRQRVGTGAGGGTSDYSRSTLAAG